MACPGGCVCGGGQPVSKRTNRGIDRSNGLYKLDRTSQIKSSEENPLISSLFEGMLKDRHDLLHVHKKSE